MGPHFNSLLDTLSALKTRHGVTAVRGEFEAEGARPEELMWLARLGHLSGLKLCLKIGGPEAVSDLIMARSLGASSLIAPMVESAYGLQKAAKAYARVYPEAEWAEVAFTFNIETRGAFENLDEILDTAASLPQVKGVVFGRVDFAGSMGLARHDLDGAMVMDCVRTVASACRDRQLDFALGGGIAPDSVEMLQKMQALYLSRYETRKIVYDPTVALSGDPAKGLELAARFELDWLKLKRDHYQRLAQEDDARIALLESRMTEAQNKPQAGTLSSSIA